MIRYIYGFVCLVLMIGLSSCNPNTPKAVASKFLNSIYHLEYDAAKNLVTDDSKRLLDAQHQFSVYLSDSERQEFKKLVVNIVKVGINDNTAVVTYTTSARPNEETIHLVKNKDKWLVRWTQEDMDVDMNNIKDAEEIPNVDTTSAPSSIEDSTQVDAEDTTSKE